MTILAKRQCITLLKRTYSKLSNAREIVRIFGLGAELQLYLHNNGITFRISKLIVGPIERFVVDRKVTLRTLCTYDHHLRTLFMEWRPDPHIIH